MKKVTCPRCKYEFSILCTNCGKPVENKGIIHDKKFFCSYDCFYELKEIEEVVNEMTKEWQENAM